MKQFLKEFGIMFAIFAPLGIIFIMQGLGII